MFSEPNELKPIDHGLFNQVDLVNYSNPGFLLCFIWPPHSLMDMAVELVARKQRLQICAGTNGSISKVGGKGSRCLHRLADWKRKGTRINTDTFCGHTAAPTSGKTVAPPAVTSLIWQNKDRKLKSDHSKWRKYFSIFSIAQNTRILVSCLHDLSKSI